MKLSARSVIIWTVLAGTVAAAVFAPQSPSSDAVVGVVQSAASKPAGAARAKARPDVVLESRPRAKADPDIVLESGPRAKAGPDIILESRPRAKADPDVVLELRPRDTRDLPIDSFSSTLWPTAAPASAPAIAAAPIAEAPPAAATAPPLPFRVLGRYIDDGRATVFMQYNEKTVIATEGTLINDQYRVETINDKAMALTYLPLNERQILMLVSAP